MIAEKIKDLEVEDINSIVTAFANIDWQKPFSTFQKYYDEQEKNERKIWVVYIGDEIAAYCTLKYSSDYYYFLAKNIPEVKDLNVLPQYRNQGIATKLLKLAEEEVLKRKLNVIGIGVGLGKEYGNAQRLYVKNGYIPDGNGITYNGKTLEYGESVMLDDDLNLWFIKKLN